MASTGALAHTGEHGVYFHDAVTMSQALIAVAIVLGASVAWNKKRAESKWVPIKIPTHSEQLHTGKNNRRSNV
tara:strand:- start:155 stop:373 length:219 start_codon:yes stop_codon:yes gene_type:complete